MKILKSEIATQLSVGGLRKKAQQCQLVSHALPATCSTPSPCLGLIPHFPFTSDPDEDTLLLFATSKSCTRDKSANCTSVVAYSGDGAPDGKSLGHKIKIKTKKKRIKQLLHPF